MANWNQVNKSFGSQTPQKTGSSWDRINKESAYQFSLYEQNRKRGLIQEQAQTYQQEAEKASSFTGLLKETLRPSNLWKATKEVFTHPKELLTPYKAVGGAIIEGEKQLTKGLADIWSIGRIAESQQKEIESNVSFINRYVSERKQEQNPDKIVKLNERISYLQNRNEEIIKGFRTDLSPQEKRAVYAGAIETGIDLGTLGLSGIVKSLFKQTGKQVIKQAGKQVLKEGAEELVETGAKKGFLQTAKNVAGSNITEGGIVGGTYGLTGTARQEDPTAKDYAVGGSLGVLFGIGTVLGGKYAGQLFSKRAAKKAEQEIITNIETKLGKIDNDEKAIIREALKEGTPQEEIVKQVESSRSAVNEMFPETKVDTKVEPKVKPKIEPETKKTAPRVEEPLIQEAPRVIDGKKYNNFEEFVKAQGKNKMYHVSDNPNLKINKDYQPKQGQLGKGLYVTKDPEIWQGGQIGKRPYVYEIDTSNLKIADDYPLRGELIDWGSKNGYYKKDFLKKPNGEYVLGQDGKPMKIWQETPKAEKLMDYKDPMTGDKMSGLRQEYLKSKGYDGVSASYSPDGEQSLIFNYNKVKINQTKTKSQLTDIWNKAQEVPKKEIPTKIETKNVPAKKESTTAKRIISRLKKNEKLSTEYDTIEINKKLDEAAQRIENNPEKAIQEAFSDTGSSVDRIATTIELFDKAVKNGDDASQAVLFNRLKELAPETAQSLNMFKALSEANPHFKYMSDIVDKRLENIKLTNSKIKEAVKGMSPEQAQKKIVSAKKEQITKEILDTKPKIKLQEAQTLLDKLIC